MSIMKIFKPNYEKWCFPAGETGVKVKEFNSQDVMLLDYAEEKDFMVWLQIIDSYNRHVPFWSRNVFIPYLPYARQDKVHHHGESSALSILIAGLIECKIKKISVLDSHIKHDYLTQIELDIIKKFYDDKIKNRITLCCFPDKNAHNHGLCVFSNYFWLNSFIFLKERTDDGLVRTNYIEDISTVKGKNVLINDDICDGGRTFINAAQILKKHGAKNIYLYVSHGIFSNGLQTLKNNGIDHVYTTNSYCRLPSNDFLTVIDIFKELL